MLPSENSPKKNGSISVENLHHSFSVNGSVVDVLRGVSLEALSGEVTAVTGASGSGKSTLLYLMGLLDRADSGKILMDGVEMQNLNDGERTLKRSQMVGFVFQFHFLIKELTVLENVRLPLLKNGIKREVADEKSLDLISELGLKNKSLRPVFKLSGGEQQRVAIARSLANSPRYILADEPTGNLDSKNSESVFELLKHLAKQQSISVVLVTHNDQLANFSDKKFCMHDGMIVT
jgi:lipoprotein-releasing system ATP-binding protein